MRDPQSGEGEIRRGETAVQRTDVVRLRCGRLVRELGLPCAVGCAGLRDADGGETGVGPGGVFVSLAERPVALIKILVTTWGIQSREEIRTSHAAVPYFASATLW